MGMSPRDRNGEERVTERNIIVQLQCSNTMPFRIQNLVIVASTVRNFKFDGSRAKSILPSKKTQCQGEPRRNLRLRPDGQSDAMGPSLM